MKTRLTEIMNIRYPLCSAGMAMIATPPLVAAVSAAGALGILGTGPAPIPWIEAAIDEVRGLTDRPFGVNLIHEQTAFGPLTTEEHIELCARKAVDLVVFFWQLPPERWIDRLHEAGARVWATAGEWSALKAAAALPIDGLMVQGREAGGHVKSEASLSDLLRRARVDYPDLLLIGAGGIATREDVRDVLSQGADGVCLGTRFVASTEANAHPDYQRKITMASADDTVVTDVFGPEWPGVPMRVIRNRAVSGAVGNQPIGHTTLFGQEYEMPPASAVLPTTETRGDMDAMCLAAGMSVRGIDSVQPAGEIIRELFDYFR